MAGRIRVQAEAFDPGAELDALARGDAGVGALVSFIGRVREDGAHAPVSRLTLEHYPGMTEKVLGAIVEQARARWELRDVVVIHRVGAMEPGEPIVLVAVAGAHRAAAFAACEFIIDRLKTRAPFWKRERTPQGDRWVEARAGDAQAAGRWDHDAGRHRG